MARARMLLRSLSVSKKFNRVPSALSCLLYTLIMSHTDVKGRIEGDELHIKLEVVPGRTEYTPENILPMLKELHEAKLIQRYMSAGSKYIQIVNFRKGQPGLREDREPPSIIPAPGKRRRSDAGVMTDQLRHDDGSTPASCRSDDGVLPDVSLLSEVKLSKEKLSKPIHPAGAGEEGDLVVVFCTLWNRLGRPVGTLKPWKLLRMPPAPSIRRKAEARLKDPAFEAGFVEMLERMRWSPVLRGENKSGWCADIYWAMKEETLAKAEAGTYDADPPSGDVSIDYDAAVQP